MKFDKYVSEIYDLLEKAKTDDERVNILIDNHNKEIETTLYYTFAPEIEFFTNEEPTYKKNKFDPDLGIIPYNAALGISYLFIKNHPKAANGLTDAKRKTLLIQTLEEMGGKEAQAFMSMILKKPGTPSLTREIVKRAYPKLLPDKVE